MNHISLDDERLTNKERRAKILFDMRNEIKPKILLLYRTILKESQKFFDPLDPQALSLFHFEIRKKFRMGKRDQKVKVIQQSLEKMDKIFQRALLANQGHINAQMKMVSMAY